MSVITCPSCHTPAPPGAIFCDNCGYDLRTVAPSQQPLPPTQLAQKAEGGEIVCPTCQHANIAGSAFCENCGAQLSPVQPPPQIPRPPTPPPISPEDQLTFVPPVPPKAPSKAPVDMQISSPPLAPAGVESIEGRLVIKDTNVVLMIPPGKKLIVMGREDPVSGIFPDIDFDPHNGHEAGVGRRHAQLVLQEGQVYVEDLDSVNGTAVNKQRLSPRQPHPLNDGDELRLGKIVMTYYAS
jgi:pSer/pThr/pTyr-binding forkhead associated (FHA) protein